MSPRTKLAAITMASAALFCAQQGCPDLDALLLDLSTCALLESTDGGTAPPISPGLDVLFEANGGQADARYQYLARTEGLSIFFSDGGAELDAGGAAVRIAFAGTRARPVPSAGDPARGRVNYLIGNDPSHWVRDIPTFRKIRYNGVYPGIDVVYYGTQGRLEHDFVVAPGADPAVIRMRLEGSSSMRVNGNGDLVVDANGRELVWRKPVLYQEAHGLRRHVEGRYRLSQGEVGFETGVYDPGVPLVIDPVVLYSTYLGRGGNETATRIAVDANENVYLTGVTNSELFPATPGAVVAPRGGAPKGNVILSKLNAGGTDLVWTTHIGGAAYDWSTAIALAADGSIVLAGTTSSENFPATRGVVQERYTHLPVFNAVPPESQGDCFVMKLNAAGNGIVWSTFLGGRAEDVCLSVALDSAGSPHLTGFTTSSNFPTTEAALQRSYRGGRDINSPLALTDSFAIKLKPDASAVEWGTFLGGTFEEMGTAIAVDKDGNVYVAGMTNSTFGFPVSANAPQSRYAGAGGSIFAELGDAFVVKLNPTGSGLVWGTFLGGMRDDIALGLALGEDNSAYVTGSTLSRDFPVTATARQANYRGEGGSKMFPAGDAFAAKINASGAAFGYVTYLGGSRDDRGMGIAVERDGSAWIAGHTLSMDYPVTDDGAQRRYAGEAAPEREAFGDAFLLKLNPAGQTLVYSSFAGGTANDWASGIALGANNAVYIAGGTSSFDFPVTAAAYQRIYGTGPLSLLPLGDAFVMKFGDRPPDPPVDPPVQPQVTVSRVANAASYEGAVVAPGEIVVIEGTLIGPPELAQAGFRTSFSDTRVLFDGVAAPLIYVSERQTSAIVPYSVARRQSTEMFVEYRGTRSRAMQIPVVPAVPGLFSANASGRGQAAALNQDGTLNNAANPASPNSVVVLFGTGEGQTDPEGVDGRINNTILPKPLLPVTVTIGGREAQVLYWGAAPGLVSGVIQVNARIETSTPSGDQPAVLRVGTAASPGGLTVAVR
jgi:uncharacterized protein (TIGR03437 family)